MSTTVNQAPVPGSRTFILTRGFSGLVGERQLGLNVNEAELFAFDFTSDLSVNGRLSELVDVSAVSGPAGGLVSSELAINGARGIAELTAVTPGEYTVAVQANYEDGSASGTIIGQISIQVG